jgi:transcriptional regulator with XRE-family HTH domain
MVLSDDRRHMVGERLAKLREKKALTLRDLEEASGIGADAISKIENGHRKPRPSTLRKLARALGVEVEDFFREPVRPLAEEPSEPKVVTGSMHARVDARTFAILVTVLTGEVYEVIDGLADRELSREEAKEEAKERLGRVLEPILQ